MFTKVHSNYTKETAEDMKNAVYEHLYHLNLHTLYKEQKVITDVWLAICRETAKEELDKIIADGNLRTYYQRLRDGAV